MLKKYKSIIRQEAKQDFLELLFWYNEKNPKLPARLKIDFRRTIKNITDNPFAHAIRYDQIRVAFLKVFPVNIHYHILPDQKTIIIIGIYHEAGDPESWIKRLND